MTTIPPLLTGAARDHDGAAHRGVLAGRCLAAARAAADPRIPPTSIDVRFASRPEPGALSVERRDSLRVAVVAGDDARPDAEAVVELAGHDVGPRAPDLEELGRWELPAVDGGPASGGCWGCGTDGQLQSRPVGSELALATLAADERAADGDHVDPAAVVALLTCPATWLAGGVPPAHLVVRFFGRVAAYEPLRLVARRDPSGQDTTSVRVALLDDDGVIAAVAATSHPA